MDNLDFKRFLSVAGITQARCAEMCYLTPRAISYYLSGERPVPRWLPEFIAFKLAVPLIELDSSESEHWPRATDLDLAAI